MLLYYWSGSYWINIRDEGNDQIIEKQYGSAFSRYLTITRSGTTLTVKIYTDAARTALEDTKSITCMTTAFRYLIAVASYEQTGTEVVDGSVANLVLPSEELEDISLDLSAWGQSREDLQAALVAAGWNLPAIDAWAAGDVWDDRSKWGHTPTDLYDLATYLYTSYEKLEDLGADLITWGTRREDLQAWLAAFSQKIEDAKAWLAAYAESRADFMAALEAAGEADYDLGTYLIVTDGIVTGDLGAYLRATDGTVERDLGLYLSVVSGIPAFRTITAQRISSVLHEVT